MNKYREFWIDESAEIYFKTFHINDYIKSKLIHVIEYSAYKDLEQKLAIAIEALELVAEYKEGRQVREDTWEVIRPGNCKLAKQALAKINQQESEG